MSCELLCVLCGETATRVADGDVRDVAGVASGIASDLRVLCPACLSGDVPSPCVSLCTLDAAQQSCRGCGRSVTEITLWHDMEPAARVAVLLRVRGFR